MAKTKRVKQEIAEIKEVKVETPRNYNIKSYKPIPRFKSGCKNC